MNKYKEMIENARSMGVANEAKMWESIEVIGDWLEELKEEHPKMYKELMRKQHVILFGKHFDEDTAIEMVEEMHHKDKQGNVHEGEYFTMEQAKIVKVKHLSNENVCDIYVALNATWHDWHCLYVEWLPNVTDEHYIKAMKRFYYEDEDYPCKEKVWKYFLG